MAVDVEEEVVEVEKDEFGDAFDEALEAEGGEEKAPTDEPAKEPEGKVEENPEEEAPKEKPIPEEVKEEPSEEDPDKKPGEEEPEPEEKPDPDEPEETLESLQHKHSTLQGMFNKLAREKKDLEDKHHSTDEPEDKGAPKAEEQPVIDASAVLDKIGKFDSFKNLEKEYGEDMTTALNEIVTATVETVTAGMSEYVDKQLGQLANIINPLQDSHVESKAEKHEAALLSAHPDAEAIIESGNMVKWIESQPDYKREMYEKIYKDGATAQVDDLFSTFKKETGIETKQDDFKDEEVIDEDKKEKAAKKKGKLEDMEDVDSKKPPVSESKGGASKNDYNGAWDEANQEQ